MPLPFLKGLPDIREIKVGLRSPWIWAVFILSLGLDIWVWRQAETRLRSQGEARFDRRVMEIRAALLNRLESQELVLHGGQGLHAAHDSLDREAWRAYIHALQLDRHHAGIQGMGFAARVRPGEKAAWERKIRAQGFPDFEIWPAPRERRDMAPIIFLEPAEGRSLRALGFDPYTDPIRREAMERARDSGETTLSGKVMLAQEHPWDSKPQAGFVMYQPIYRPDQPIHTVEQRRAGLEGYVYSAFRAGDLILGILPDSEAHGVGFAIFDGHGTGPDSLLYRSEDARSAASGWAGRLARTETLALYGHAWTIRYAATPRFLGPEEGSHARLLLILGGAASLLLAAAMLILTTTRMRAERLAAQMTAELRALQGSLENQVAQRTLDLERANRDLGAEMQRREESEEQLRQAQKMEAIGRLAGGVAHDFNNLLTAINGYAALTLDSLEAGSPLRGNLEEIRRAGDMAASLTRQLLAYSRKQVFSLRLVNLNEVVGDIGRVIQHLIGGKTEVELRLSPDAGAVKVDPTQLQQVLVNLAINARDAMPDGGRLTIETGTADLERPDTGGLVGEAARAGEAGIPPGRYASLTVRDTGHGMDDEVKSRLFEPYFTTKQRGRDKGTGLGLSMVYGIVRQSGGHIQVFSEPGLGTAFRILLPEQAVNAPLVDAK